MLLHKILYVVCAFNLWWLPQEHSQQGPSSISGKKKKRHDTKFKFKFAVRRTNRETSSKFSMGESGVRD